MFKWRAQAGKMLNRPLDGSRQPTSIPFVHPPLQWSVERVSTSRMASLVGTLRMWMDSIMLRFKSRPGYSRRGLSNSIRPKPSGCVSQFRVCAILQWVQGEPPSRSFIYNHAPTNEKRPPVHSLEAVFAGFISNVLLSGIAPSWCFGLKRWPHSSSSSIITVVHIADGVIVGCPVVGKDVDTPSIQHPVPFLKRSCSCQRRCRCRW